MNEHKAQKARLRWSFALLPMGNLGRDAGVLVSPLAGSLVAGGIECYSSRSSTDLSVSFF